MRFDLSTYETVEERLNKFWEMYPDGRVFTELLHYTDKQVVVRASIYKHRDHANPDSTGIAEEVFGSSPVNKTSFVENCETSALGRACANLNLSAKGKRPSREEMSKANRRADEQQSDTVSTQVVTIGLTAQQIKWAETKIRSLNMEPSEYVGAILGRKIDSLRDVQPDEASKVIQAIAKGNK